MGRKKNNSGGKAGPVESIRHKDSRKNIPTEELRDFVREDEETPRTMLYPRDPSLDPQLVWKGKDEQDRNPLEVPVLPIYIQEKIHPQALVEDLRERYGKRPTEQQLDLFADFNGIDTFEKKVDFYRHDAHWSNRMILGDSLAVMTSLAEKEGLKGQVQMIYIDPPYGINFRSNWQVSTRTVDVKDRADDMTRQPEQIAAFRDTWLLGIHSYLAYLRDRLSAARELLTESGSVFVQIGDENLHLVRSLLDEVFGSDNFQALITFRKTSITFATGRLGGVCDYLLWYTKSASSRRYRQLYLEKQIGGVGASNYGFVELDDGTARRMTQEEKDGTEPVPPGSRVFSTENLMSGGATESCIYEVDFHGQPYRPVRGRSWKTHRDGLARLIRVGRCIPLGDERLYFVTYFDEYPITKLTNAWYDTRGEMDPKYVVQTYSEVVRRCMAMTSDPGELILDPTCGSGTTAWVAEELGRRWITTDTSRVALALARTRLMAARFPYYLLSDSPEGVKKEAEITRRTPPSFKTDGDIKKGFVYRRVPHVTLGSIANNEEIDVVHAKWQQKLEPIQVEINKALKKTWEEWDIPREPEAGWPAVVKKKLGEWWELRRARQKEIDASIAKAADPELLFDRPHEDNKRVRVTGPFTVESLSPHRRLTVQAKIDMKEKGVAGWSVRNVGPDKFGNMIIDNLRKAGVQNRDKSERLKFDRLEPYAGEWIHAAGEFTDKSGQSKRVAVCIGPEHGTVGPDLVKEAAKEAVKGVGFDLLYVCGFAFDPHVDEETKRYGKLNVQVCRMNPDLSMGDELLKKTGAGNLFMVFGEPDITIKKVREKGTDGERVIVEIRGIDVYDPTTGQIRSNSTDDIACWFIDTNYDGESFFVRHAYFTGADQPYEKLKRALRAEIDEAAWSALYSTKSQPFPIPSTGKIAVKVINHYGDEVLKVYPVG
jgi:adenine-specific DNA-methyltransferase